MQVVLRSASRIWKVCILTLCLAVGILSAAVADYEGQPVGSIAFEPAQQPLTAVELEQVVVLRTGAPLKLAEVRESLSRLFATGRYSDIAVEAESKGGEVAVRFLTKGAWFVNAVSVTGVPSPPGSGELVNSTGLTLGSPLDSDGVTRAVEQLQRVLTANGFYQAKIEPRFSFGDSQTQQEDVEFVVTPGVRARYGALVVQGNLTRPTAKIIGDTGWKGWFGWQPVNETRTQRGIESILQAYRKQNYLMAKVTLVRIDHNPATGRAIPVLEIAEGSPVVIETAGAKVSQSRLRRLVPVFEEQSVDLDLLLEGVRNLTDYFQMQGYFDAKIDVPSQTVDNGVLRIRYVIERGDRHKLAQIEVQGNRYFNTTTIRERMFVTPASTQVRRGRYSASMLLHDVDAIRGLYLTNGFRDVKVSSEVQSDFGGKAGDIAVAIKIEEGSQWFVSRVEFTGASAESEKAIRSMLQAGSGQPFSEANVASDRDNILAYYFEQGYSEVSFDWSYADSGKPNQVNLRYMIVEGQRHFVRTIFVNGLKTTRPGLVERRISLKAGDPVSQTQMLATERRLYDLGIFAKVDMAVQNPDGEEPDRNLVLQLEESRKYSMSAGFGLEIARIGGGQTSLESPAGQAGFSPRVSLGLSRLNFLGWAHTVSLRGRASSLQQRAEVTYLAPQIRGWQSVDLSFTALFDTSRDVRTFSVRRWEVSAQIAQRWTRSRTVFYRMAYRRVGVSAVKINELLIPLLSQSVRVGMPSIAYVDDRRDDPVDSRRGTYNSLDMGVANKYFGSQADFFRLLARNSTYHPIGPRLVLARNFSFGWIQPLRIPSGATTEFQAIPLAERFFAGGASSHRGFPDNQAGPRDTATGFPLGGNALLVFNTELRFPLIGANLGGVLFHDMGNVYSRVQDVSFRLRQRGLQDFNYMVHSPGIGIRYRTPIGPVRIDIAYSPNSPRFFGCSGTLDQRVACSDPKNNLQTDQRISRFQFHFSLGQTF
jgi:outer membrane protein assembly complex protein YaeT